MKNIKKIFCSVVISAVLVASVAPLPAGQQILSADAATTIRLNKMSAKLSIDEKITLLIKGTKKKAKWSSSNIAVATVSNSGVVKGVGEGSAIITAKIGKKKLKCKVIVEEEETYLTVNDTGINYQVIEKDCYSNWEGTTNVCQFKGTDGNLWFAYDKGSTVKVVNAIETREVTLAKENDLFGAVTCDSDGYFYMVTGKNNETDDTSVDTIFITKYNPLGTKVAEVGDNGRSSLADYYEDDYCTKNPFDAGCCDVAINGDYLAVNYAREMYNGHQSNSVFMIDKTTMSKIQVDGYYNSHSFAQRVIPCGDGFLLASEGDAYPRAFRISFVDTSGNVWSYSTFHFWVEPNSSTNMLNVNENFADMGGLALGADGNAAFLGSSAPSLSESAEKEKRQLFVQIFDPMDDLDTPGAYVTSGERSGLSGINGDESVTDYGILWLKSAFSEDSQQPQIVSCDDGYWIFFEQCDDTYGLYAEKIDNSGNVITPAFQVSKKAQLNPTEMPVFINGYIYWVGNKCDSNELYVFSMKA